MWTFLRTVRVQRRYIFMDQPMIMGLSVGLAVAVVGFLVSYFAGKKVAAAEPISIRLPMMSSIAALVLI